ncbi:MAG: xylulokinase [Acidimicrobiales bacterium]
MPLVLGVDSSTQATKVEVRDVDTGELVAAGRAPHAPVSPPRAEQDPAAWWAALARAVFDAGVDDVAALAVAGQQHGLVALDDAGTVLRPAKLWNDTESAPDARRLVARLGPAGWSEACGSVPVASFTVTKVAWLAEHEPEVLDRLATLLLPHDWLTHQLTGRAVTDRGDASGTGYWSPATGRWRPDLLDLAAPRPGGWVGALPTVLGPTEPAGPLTPWAADQLGLRAGALVGPGTGDNMAAALGVGLAGGDVAISVGTSGTVFATSPTPTADASGAVAGFADATGRFLPLVCTLNAALVLDAVARLLAVDHASFDQLALTAPAGAEGLVLLPYLAGERTPNRPDATGTLTGLRPDVSRAALARAAVEGVVCGLLDGLDALVAAGVPIADAGRLVLVGGGARSAAVRQVVADLTGRPVTLPAGDEHVAAGACVKAAAVLLERDPVEVARAWAGDEAVTVEPGPQVEHRDQVRGAYARVRDEQADPPPGRDTDPDR